MGAETPSTANVVGVMLVLVAAVVVVVVAVAAVCRRMLLVVRPGVARWEAQAAAVAAVPPRARVACSDP